MTPSSRSRPNRSMSTSGMRCSLTSATCFAKRVRHRNNEQRRTRPSRVPGLTLVGEVTDRLGRTGVAVALDIVEERAGDFLYRYMLVFDPEQQTCSRNSRKFFQ